MDQNFQETNLKFEVTYQQIEIFKVFEKKTETDQENEEMDIKFEETDQF